MATDTAAAIEFISGPKETFLSARYLLQLKVQILSSHYM